MVTFTASLLILMFLLHRVVKLLPFVSDKKTHKHLNDAGDGKNALEGVGNTKQSSTTIYGPQEATGLEVIYTLDCSTNPRVGIIQHYTTSPSPVSEDISTETIEDNSCGPSVSVLMEGLLNQEDTIKMIEEQLCIKESQEMKLIASIEELKQHCDTSSKVNSINSRPDSTLNSLNQELISDTITKRNFELKEVHCEKTTLIKQLQQLVEEKNKIHQLQQTNKETDNLCEHTYISEYAMESEQQSEELKHDLPVPQESEDRLKFQRDAILNHSYKLMKQLEAANHKLNDMIDKHKEITEELESSTKRNDEMKSTIEKLQDCNIQPNSEKHCLLQFLDEKMRQLQDMEVTLKQQREVIDEKGKTVNSIKVEMQQQQQQQQYINNNAENSEREGK